MKILAPVTSAREASALIAAGAGELYCGMNPKQWIKNFGQDSWINRRDPGNANIPNIQELKRTVDIAHRQDVPVFLALNQCQYPPEQYPLLQSIIQEAQKCGIDAFIIGDPGLMLFMVENFPGTAIHVSSLAAVLNSSAVHFFKEIGASRIIFPRYIDLDELKIIQDKAGRELEYEVFILNDGCSFEEGFCHVNHAFGGAICHRPWSYRLVSTSGGDRWSVKESFTKHLKDYQKWLWFVRNCHGGPGPKGHPVGMCGLCALPELHSLGVQSLKIVGREAPGGKKIASVKLVKRVMDAVVSGIEADKVKELAKRIRGTPALCTGYMCYYR
ncbi:peptidase U32 family protein [Desulforamulus ruminis]|uniref:Peptidase U32 n=1 Tax=Desulforamulus ruminis (strain ATCC 23193 / DSM 2154 / NCIMB 8452 / DL) TaxID=696281 RepID=F6DKW0_DESRL|nr:U32 family peptidase [Desulforamulus ruminis]AEG61592.1 peptidase U32 [Desulforamulus ruminis DSM 2154]